MENKANLDHQLIEQLEELHESAQRDPHAAAAARIAFLTEARNAAAQRVPPKPLQRLKEWMAAITVFLAAPRKEKGAPMFSTVITLIVVLSLALGGGTVAASQASMPDDALYQVKTWSEDARIAISTNQEAQFQLALGFATRRMREIQTMLQADKTPPEVVMTRLQNELNYALRLTMNMPDSQSQPALLQLQTQLQQHDRAMIQLQLNQDVDPALLQIRDQIRTMLQQQLQLCQSGIENPEWLREQLRTRDQDLIQQQLQDGTQNQNQNGEQYQNGEQNQNQQGELNQNQNQNSEQYQYQNQNQNSEQNQNQQGELNQNQNGPNEEIPAIGPSEAPAPGVGDCPNCPLGDCVCDGSGQIDQIGNVGKP